MPTIDQPLLINSADGALHRGRERFDAWALAWRPAEPLSDGRPIEPRAALTHLFARRDTRRVPVGVIGPRDATASEYERAFGLGKALASIGFTVICGGRQGAMEAVSKGVAEAGGIPIGILPDHDWQEANDFVAIPLATGIGEARNAIIATASFALVAVGGGYGTLSEMALGLRLGRLVIAMPESHHVEGAVQLTEIADVCEHLTRRYLVLDRG
ncbi:TIGR00725 family protein [Phreatobacter aquaticus]|uniref:TIGR00725 family protein n=1 Tax=Phreatobacter aquaticus TaxID=2570229 RepID=A0A4D7QQQ2_9HYPH|nr:TIGR00725 family protein [Phreatobacter aquaticus]QCK87574.1 TIGR00725 family protein [Phreatobacter aquaticus]